MGDALHRLSKAPWPGFGKFSERPAQYRGFRRLQRRHQRRVVAPGNVAQIIISGPALPGEREMLDSAIGRVAAAGDETAVAEACLLDTADAADGGARGEDAGGR